MTFQYHNGRDKLEGVRSEVDHSIEGADDKDEARMPSEEMKGRARQDRNWTAVAKDKNRGIIGNGDQAQEYIAEAEVENSKLFHRELDSYLLPFTLLNKQPAKPITKGKPRAPPWNKGLKMKKAAVGERVNDETKKPPRNKGLKIKKAAVGATVQDGTNKTPRNMAPEMDAIGQIRNSAIIAASLERVHDETLAVGNEEAVENIVDNATNIGELNTEVTGLTDVEEIGVYTGRVSRDAVDEVAISELNANAAGVANDIGVYHHDASRDAGDENSIVAPNTDAAGVAHDEDTRVYHQGADDEHNVGKLNTDAAGDEDTGLCHQCAFRDEDDEDYVGEPNTDATGVANNEDTGVYHQQDIRDAGPHLYVGELGSDISGFDADNAVRVHNNQASPNPKDEPMGDAPNDTLESSRDDSSDLTSCNTDSPSPNIIARAKGSSEVYAGMELPDQAMGELKSIIFSEIKDVIMGEAENRTEGGAEEGPGETAQRI